MSDMQAIGWLMIIVPSIAMICIGFISSARLHGWTRTLKEFGVIFAISGYLTAVIFLVTGRWS